MTEPTKIKIPWARDDGTKATIPETSQIGIVDGRASFPDGFVPLNGTPKAAGGIPPFKQDMNGILYAITNALKWVCSGGLFKRDATFQTDIGGYPQGAILLKSDNSALWFSTADNNATNPDAGGAGWLSIDPRLYAVAAGTTTAYTATFSSSFTTVTDDLIVYVNTTSVGTNTTSTPTFSANGLTPRTIVKLDGSALALGDMPNRAVLSYDLTNTRWLLMNPVGAELVGQVVMVATATAPTNFLKCNGAAISRTTYAQLFDRLVTSQGFASRNFTVSIASPAIFTLNAHGFVGGERLRLSTTGALPTGLNTSTDYFVEVFDANTFYLSSLVSGGQRLGTSGSQSGTHSFIQSLYGLGDGSTTFNLPDFRGLFLRGFDDGAGIDSNHYIGSKQRGTILPLDTNLGSTSAVWALSTNQISNLTLSRNGHSADAVTDNNQYASIGIYSAAASQSSPLALSTAIGTDGSLATGVARPVNASVNYCIRYK